MKDYLKEAGITIVGHENGEFESNDHLTYGTKLIYQRGEERRRLLVPGCVDADAAIAVLNRAVKITLMENKVREAAQKRGPMKSSAYIGEIGKRIEMQGEVTMVRTFKKVIEEQEHDAYITLVRTEQGAIKYWNLLRIKTPTGPVEIKEGQMVHFRATISEHTEYKGEKQTTVQRAHVIAIL